MKLTVLTENTAGGEFLAEHGLSYFIEFNGTKVLFDTGHSDTFLKNAQRLGIDINNDINIIILSHGHWDHGNGLKYLHNKTLITHPQAFIKRYRKSSDVNIGLELSQNDLNKKFNAILTSDPYKITDEIIFLGSIPRLNDFESKTTSFVDENGEPDFVPDDSALVLIKNSELIIISGCSHSGICNIIEYAKKTCSINKVKTVIGGFHLKKNNSQTQQTIKFFNDNNIKHIHPSHCTEFEALASFANEFRIKITKTGTIINY